jgi:hypothetical protein
VDDGDLDLYIIGGGAPEPVLRATLENAGLIPVAEEMDLPWHLRLHARATMVYSAHALACRRGALAGQPA